MPRSRLRRFFPELLLYILLGPPIGAAFIVLFSMVALPLKPGTQFSSAAQFIGFYLTLLPAAIFVSYVAGTLPAALTSLSVMLLIPDRPSMGGFVLAAAIGAAVTALLTWNTPLASTAEGGLWNLFVLALTGAVATAAVLRVSRGAPYGPWHSLGSCSSPKR